MADIKNTMLLCQNKLKLKQFKLIVLNAASESQWHHGIVKYKYKKNYINFEIG